MSVSWVLKPRLFGVDRRKGNHRLHPRLVEHDTNQKTAQVLVVCRVPQSVRQTRERRSNQRRACRQRLRRSAFAQDGEGRQARQREQGRGNEHGHGHELRRRLAGGLRPGHVSQAGAQRDQPADITQAPAPARYLAQVPAARQLRQECRDQIAPGAEKKVRYDYADHCDRKIAGAGQGESCRAEHLSLIHISEPTRPY